MQNANKRAENETGFPQIERDGWRAENVAEESVNQMPDETARQMARGDESNKESSDDKDIAGASDAIDTPQGREEAKAKDKKI